MRLTLRTMLAYLDDILDPEEKEDIGRKIEESGFASELVHRTRDVMRRLRLDAPQLAGRGMGLDPNTVAEYLDNTLGQERVADFERVCLESDVHLAEVASCHQILTLVLGEPADVAAKSRRRMYATAQHAEQPERDSVERVGAPTVSLSEEPPASRGRKTKRRPKPTVPDYLRESSRSRFRRVATLVVVGVGLCAVAYWGFGPDGDDGPGVEAPMVDGGVAFDPGSALGEPSGAPVFSGGVPDFSNASPEEDSTGLPAIADPTLPDVVLPGEPVPVAGLPVAELPVAGLPVAGLEADGLLTFPSTDVSTVEAATEPGGVPVVIPDIVVSEPPKEATLFPVEPEAAVKEHPPSIERVGTYVSDKDVLLRHDKESGEWRRLPSRAPLAAGDRLLGLPTFRPTIALASGLTLQLASGSAIVLEGADAEGIPGVTIEYGSVVMLNVGQAANRLKVGLGQDEQMVSFAEGAELAIELQREHTPGVNPTTAQAAMVVNLYATSGKLRWGSEDAAFDVEAPASWQFPDGRPDTTVKVGPPPEWIHSENLGQLERQASFTMEQALLSDRSASLTLSELVDGQGLGRRLEVRSLAARCSVYVGQFEPFVIALNDSDQRSHWLKHIEALRESLVWGPDVAVSIHSAFERQLGEDADALFRMLWAYGPENLTQGMAKALVESLDDDRLDFRVLALWNLKEITGLGPPNWLQDPRADRQRLVRRWKERLRAGEVVGRQSIAGAAVDKELVK